MGVQIPPSAPFLQRPNVHRCVRGSNREKAIKQLTKSRRAVQPDLGASVSSGREVARVNSNNNGFNNFLPKALPPAVNDVLFHYRSSPAPTRVAADLVVTPGEESVVTLDSGIVFKEATSTDVTGWDLVPIVSQEGVAEAQGQEEGQAEVEPLLQARPPFGNKDTLWMPYIVPPGHYRLLVHIEGMNAPLTLAEDLEIQPGQTLEFDGQL